MAKKRHDFLAPFPLEQPNLAECGVSPIYDVVTAIDIVFIVLTWLGILHKPGVMVTLKDVNQLQPIPHTTHEGDTEHLSLWSAFQPI